MSRFLLLVVLAAFFVACVERPPAVRKRSKDGKSTTAETAGADLEGDDADDDDDGADPKPTSKPQSTTPTTPATTPTETPAPAPAPKEVFDNAPAFAGNAPAKESSDHHQGSSNQGKECMSCHSAGKGAPTFAFAGTIRTTKTSLEGAAGVEVRVIDDKGNPIGLVTSDSVGNFWLPGTVAIPGGSKVAIRTAGGAVKMSGAIATGACNMSGCHTSDRPIFLAN